jgi:hypothetical protein
MAGVAGHLRREVVEDVAGAPRARHESVRWSCGDAGGTRLPPIGRADSGHSSHREGDHVRLSRSVSDGLKNDEEEAQERPALAAVRDQLRRASDAYSDSWRSGTQGRQRHPSWRAVVGAAGSSRLGDHDERYTQAVGRRTGADRWAPARRDVNGRGSRITSRVWRRVHPARRSLLGSDAGSRCRTRSRGRAAEGLGAPRRRG